MPTLISRPWTRAARRYSLPRMTQLDSNTSPYLADAYANDRKHVFRLQGNVDLPWSLALSGSLNWQSGRPFNRQGRARLDQGSVWVILDPNSDDRRLPSTFVLDLGLGKRWKLGERALLKTDLQVLNVTNEDAHQFVETQRLLPGEQYVPDSYVYPRRYMIRLGIEF